MGRWKNFPYQVEVLDSFNDPNVASLTLMWASQLLGKTSCLESALLWMIDQCAGPTIMVFPTEANAGHWSKNRLTPLLDGCAVLRDVIEPTSSRRLKHLGIGSNTILHKTFKGGWLILGGANSPANLAAHTSKWTIFDEIDKFPESSGNEGDTILLAEQRSARYTDAFSVKTSTPTLEGMSRVARELESTDCRRWFIRCLHCQEEFVLAWRDVRWDKGESKLGTKVHLTETAHVVCPVCNTHHDELARIKMVTEGRWVPTRPEIKSRRGYALNALNVLGPCKRGFVSWMHYLVDRFLDAERLGIEGQKTFVNLILGEPFVLETTPPPDHLALYQRRELYPEFEGEVIIPERCLLLTCGADVQSDRIEAEILGYGLNEETWGISYRVFKGDTELPDIFAEFDTWVRKKWRHASGHMMWPAAVAIDAGNKPTQPYAYVMRARREYVFAVKGNRGYVSHWVQRSGTRRPLMILKVDGPKERLYSQLRLTEYGAGFQHFPSNPSAGYDMVYFEQLTAEKMVRGTSAPYFEKIHRRANEALDARIYALAAREFLPSISYAKIQANLATPPEGDWRPNREPPKPPEPLPVVPDPSTVIPPNQRTPAPEPPPKPRATRRTMNGWGRAWRVEQKEWRLFL
jgi:phage terminase large subunit GpA-like protein